jgi:hypothetical protein
MNLKDVTLLAVSSIKIAETISALKKSCAIIDFAEVKLITHQNPKKLPAQISFEPCPKLNNIHDYNHYVFRDLGKHVNTSHCLLIQYDSWILRPDLWENNWLEYDYIGAPWAYSEDSYISPNGEHVRVGNGGFSLRSKKLLDLPRSIDLQLIHDRGFYNEDGNICVYYRETFLENGIKYAPIDLASRFAYERDVAENMNTKPFGFHKYQK